MSNQVGQRLARAGADVGHRVHVEGPTFEGEGRVMPSHAFSAPDTLILKLDTGYNIGIRLDDKTTITHVSNPPPDAPKRAPPTAAKDLPTVAMLGTGGTIASYVDYRTGAVHPAATAEELAFAVPELFDEFDVRPQVVFQQFSEDLTPDDWAMLAKAVAAAFEAGARGVVIPHGTDTMGYTAAAMAFMLQDLPGPVILVGSQRSSDRPSTDAAANLMAACRVAATVPAGEVLVMLHAGPTDDRIAIHRGTRVRKNHTSRRDAFESVNQRPLGHVLGKEVVLDEALAPPAPKGPRLVPGWNADVGFLHTVPGLPPKALETMAGAGLVIAGTGLGHAPRQTMEALRGLIDQGCVVVMTSQCIWGRTNLRVYSTGRDLLQLGVVEAGDMLPEVAWVKLQHCLGVARDRAHAIELFNEPLAGESSMRTPFQEGRA